MTVAMQCGTLNGTKTNGVESIYEDLSWNGSIADDAPIFCW